MKIEGINKGSYYFIQIGKEFNVKTLLEIRRVVETAMDQGHFNLSFGMQKCETIDSSGIGLVMNLYRKCTDRGGKISFIQPLPDIKEILSVANIEKYIQYYDSEDQITGAK